MFEEDIPQFWGGMERDKMWIDSNQQGTDGRAETPEPLQEMLFPMKLLYTPFLYWALEIFHISIIINCFPCLWFWLEDEIEEMGVKDVWHCWVKEASPGKQQQSGHMHLMMCMETSPWGWNLSRNCRVPRTLFSMLRIWEWRVTSNNRTKLYWFYWFLACTKMKSLMVIGRQWCKLE